MTAEAPLFPPARARLRPASRRRRRRRAAQPLEHAGDDAVAARPGEGEDVGRRHVHLLGERLAQQRAGAKHARADRRRRDRQALGRFLDRHLLDLAQDERGAKGERQRVDLLLEQAAQLGAHRAGLRRCVRVVVHRLLHRLGAARRAVVEQGDDVVATARAQPPERLVDDDAREPGRQARVAAEFRQVPVGGRGRPPGARPRRRRRRERSRARRGTAPCCAGA